MTSAAQPRPRREPAFTVLRATLLLALAIVACGGAQRGGGNHYKAAASAQSACCAQLKDPNEVALCRDRIARIEDPEVEASPANQATFACVERHFVCDPQTGDATAKSKQNQLDCLSDLEAAER